jgi:hypothetical protein
LAVSPPTPNGQAKSTESIQETRLQELRETGRTRPDFYETLGALPEAEIMRVRRAIDALVLEQLELANGLSLALPDVPTLEEYRKCMEAWAAYHRAVAARITFDADAYECVDMRFMRNPRPGKSGRASIGMNGHVLDSNGSQRPVMILIDIDHERHPEVARFSEHANNALAAENRQKAVEFNALDADERARRIQAHLTAQQAVQVTFRDPPSAERDARLTELGSRLISSQFRIDLSSNTISPRLSR